MMKFDEKLYDTKSKEFEELSNAIENDLMDMLRNEKELIEQADFTVKVQNFQPGSVICNFKVNYVLKEAYLAIPFAIKTSNVSDVLNNNFKFKKGILFQRFLIAAGSFNSTNPVDHCKTKGCSHKCDYDYEISDYKCTCPKVLALDVDSLTCVLPEQVGKNPITSNTKSESGSAQEESNSDKATSPATTAEAGSTEAPIVEVGTAETGTTESESTESAVKMSGESETTTADTGVTEATGRDDLSPIDCEWSAWNEWSSCLENCKKERTRTVASEAKNGGSCTGRFKEIEDCSASECSNAVINDITTLAPADASTDKIEGSGKEETGSDISDVESRINKEGSGENVTERETTEQPTTESNTEEGSGIKVNAVDVQKQDMGEEETTEGSGSGETITNVTEDSLELETTSKKLPEVAELSPTTVKNEDEIGTTQKSTEGSTEADENEETTFSVGILKVSGDTTASPDLTTTAGSEVKVEEVSATGNIDTKLVTNTEDMTTLTTEASASVDQSKEAEGTEAGTITDTPRSFPEARKDDEGTTEAPSAAQESVTEAKKEEEQVSSTISDETETDLIGQTTVVSKNSKDVETVTDIAQTTLDEELIVKNFNQTETDATTEIPEHSKTIETKNSTQLDEEATTVSFPSTIEEANIDTATDKEKNSTTMLSDEETTVSSLDSSLLTMSPKSDLGGEQTTSGNTESFSSTVRDDTTNANENVSGGESDEKTEGTTVDSLGTEKTNSVKTDINGADDNSSTVSGRGFDITESTPMVDKTSETKSPIEDQTTFSSLDKSTEATNSEKSTEKTDETLTTPSQGTDKIIDETVESSITEASTKEEEETTDQTTFADDSITVSSAKTDKPLKDEQTAEVAGKVSEPLDDSAGKTLTEDKEVNSTKSGDQTAVTEKIEETEEETTKNAEQSTQKAEINTVTVDINDESNIQTTTPDENSTEVAEKMAKSDDTVTSEQDNKTSVEPEKTTQTSTKSEATEAGTQSTEHTTEAEEAVTETVDKIKKSGNKPEDEASSETIEQTTDPDEGSTEVPSTSKTIETEKESKENEITTTGPSATVESGDMTTDSSADKELTSVSTLEANIKSDIAGSTESTSGASSTESGPSTETSSTESGTSTGARSTEPDTSAGTSSTESGPSSAAGTTESGTSTAASSTESGTSTDASSTDSGTSTGASSTESDTSAKTNEEATTSASSSEASEVTTLSVISVHTDEDTTTLITTIRPELAQDDDISNNDIDEETTSAATTDEPVATTESGVHEFTCVEVGQDTLETKPDQIPMRCTSEAVGEEATSEPPRQIFIVISKNQVDESQLFAKNVKVVVKDFMIMDVSPK
jgi:hypothetical protein